MSLNMEMVREELLLMPILDSMAEGLIIVDADLKISYLNSTAEKIFETTSVQVAEKPYTVLTHLLEFQKVLSASEIIYTTTVNIKNQEFLVNMGAIESQSQVHGAYAILQPLGNLPLQQLETFLENPYEGILILDPQSNVTYANQACYQYFKCRTLEELKKHIEPFSPNSCLSRALLTGKPVSGEAIVINNEKVETTYLPIIEDKQTLGVIVKCKVSSTANEWNYYMEKYAPTSARYSMEDIVGRDYQLLRQKELAIKASRTTSTILITGESGTGKEVFAHAIHNISPRKSQPFIRVNCAAVPENLLESELFGYSDGAFTGAKKGGKPGKFELANRGTIFLDEIADMSLAMQAKLLRVLQEKEIERVGSTSIIRVDVRVVAATNQNLEALVSEGAFREDLYYRLNVIVIDLPPLRKRTSDIDLLALRLLERLNAQLGTRVKGISPEVMDLFRQYPWPGNIRELENVLEHAVNFCEKEVIELNNLPGFFREYAEKPFLLKPEGLESTLMETEKEIIMNTLQETQGNKSQAARRLNIHRSVLYRKLQKYNINF